jgi:trimethylguanosine synthase
MEQIFGSTPPRGSNNRSPPRHLHNNDFARAQSPAEDPGSKRNRNKKTPGTPQTPPAKRENRPVPADMVVLVTRTDLYDAAKHSEECDPIHSPAVGYPRPPVADYQYHGTANGRGGTVAVCRVPPSPSLQNPFWMQLCVFDKSVPNPFDPLIQKYWNQRRRLFSRFDQGILLDQEGWFSVTPEQIADHVAARTVDLYRVIQPAAEQGMIVLDAFCGCGGNSIAFGKQAAVSQVICVDIDRSKLQRAASNAAIYQIPPSKIIFIECNVLFLLEHCYRNGAFILDQPIDTPEKAMAMIAAMPPPVPTETTSHGYYIGGIDMLPRKIDAVFMDPPWGGVDYEVFGKNGYCLERNMRIPRPANQIARQATSTEGVTDGFFDNFCVTQPRNKQERKAAFNSGLDENNCVNGAELLHLAAAAATNAQVVYDVPRNTSRTSLGQAALTAGYSGNCKLEEHYLNGRLKTVTAYFGTDWRSSLLPDGGSSME